MRTDTPTLIERPEDLTTEWLTAALAGATVTGFDYQRIGTGQMSECYRVRLQYADGADGPASVVLKVAAADATSRQTGLALGLYEREVRFYSDLAPGLAGPVAHCHHHAFDPHTGVFDLLLDDAAPAQVGDEIRGATIEEATLAVTELGRMHGPVLGDESLAGAQWLNREAPVTQALISALYAGFADRYAEQMTDDQIAVCERLVTGFDDYLAAEAAQERPKGLVHGDYRLDNMLFGLDGADKALTVVDWQTVTWGPALTDLAYFLGCALPTERRRAQYDQLLAAYHHGLGPDPALTLDEVRQGVRRQSFFGVMMAIVSSMLVERTARGDEMFMTMLERHCSHVIDTGALSLLEESRPAEPLQPNVSDEAAHQPGDEKLWNESWYFDFADPATGLGGWIRLGLYPNQERAWVNVLICGPARPTIAVNDYAVPMPADPTEVSAAGLFVRQEVVQPLGRYRVSAGGDGRRFDDPADLLHGQPGTPAQVTVDLTWDTVGTPYQYRITPRYEIPCTVTGTVTIDGATHRIEAASGQRDHSWGVRDWWGMDWVWHAVHLEDGTHLHGVEVRIDGMPPMAVGYQQRAGEPLVELQAVNARETFAPNDLPLHTEMTLQPGGVEVAADVVATAPVLLTSDDGRVSQFPRAWVAVRTSDGRTGRGWMEWNRNR